MVLKLWIFHQVNPSRDSTGIVERVGSVKSTDSNDSVDFTISAEPESRVCYETKIIGGVPVRTVKVDI